jgi:hypothetical protein
MVEQQGQQEDVINAGEKITKISLELFYNQEYNPAADDLLLACIKGFNMDLEKAGKNFIAHWLRLYKRIWVHVSDDKAKELEKIRDYMYQFHTSNITKDYQKLLNCLLITDTIIKDSGLFNITITRTDILLDAGDLDYLFTHA